ncbi:proteoglycan 4 [Drosophila biarmipes]|uniref:proteoglycan 4 n=1 Tax=Drosophila biarmipes TaxID=125945 RepID=UPI0007E7059B|nr:proteoglycan 4 [Drosophila biarmipes]
MSLEPKDISVTGMDENEVSPKVEENPNTVPVNDIIPQNTTDAAHMEEIAQKSEEDPRILPHNEDNNAIKQEIPHKSEESLNRVPKMEIIAQNEINDAPMDEVSQKSEEDSDDLSEEIPQGSKKVPNPIPIISNKTDFETNDAPMEEVPQESDEVPQKAEDIPQQSEEKAVTEVESAVKLEKEVSSTVVVMVEQPNTIIELVDLYVPPVSLVPSKVIFMNNDAPRPFFSPAVPQALPKDNATLLYTEPTSTSLETPSGSSAATGDADDNTAKGGRRRGRKPATPKTGPTKRRRRAQMPPPLPPPPNFLENCINPLENEIYPKVIVQPAHQPWVLPRDLNGGDPSKAEAQPPVAVPVSGEVATSTTQSQPAVSDAQLRQKLQLFGPDVQLTQLRGHDPARFKAVRQEPNGDQTQLIFTAQQLVSFSHNHGKFIDLLSAQGHLPTPTPATISHYFPGPGGQLLASQYFASQQGVFKAPDATFKAPAPAPDPVFKVPTKRPPPAPTSARFLNPTYLRSSPRPLNGFRTATAPYGPAKLAALSAPTAPTSPTAPYTLRASAPAATPPASSSSTPPSAPAIASPPAPEIKKSPFVITPVFALPSILKHKSQEKLRNTLQVQRAKKAAEELSKLARTIQGKEQEEADKENKEADKEKEEEEGKEKVDAKDSQS